MPPFDFDPFDEAFRRDPYAAYARGRREHSVFAHPNFPVVSLFRYQDAQAVLRDPSQWSNFFPLPPGMERPDDMPPSMLGVDPPEHTRLRGLVSQAFTPRMIRRLEPRLREIARGFSPRLRELVGYGIYNGLVGHIDKRNPTFLLEGDTDDSGMIWDRDAGGR